MSIEPNSDETQTPVADAIAKNKLRNMLAHDSAFLAHQLEKLATRRAQRAAVANSPVNDDLKKTPGLR